jgi:hypothetical protein
VNTGTGTGTDTGTGSGTGTETPGRPTSPDIADVLHEDFARTEAGLRYHLQNACKVSGRCDAEA